MKKLFITIFIFIAFILTFGVVKLEAQTERIAIREGFNYRVGFEGEVLGNTQFAKLERVKDGSTVYCAEPKKIVKEDVNYTGIPFNTNTQFSKESTKMASKLAYYGYQYKDHTSASYYIATQMLVWQALYPKTLFYYTDMNKKVIDNPFIKEESEIRNLASNAMKGIVFEGNLDNYTINKIYTLKDKHNLLKDFDLIYKDEGFKGELKEDRLIFHFDKPGEYKIKLKSKPVDTSIMFFAPGSQTVFTIGSYEPEEYEFTFKVHEGSIKLKKKDADIKEFDERLKGTVFSLLNVFNEEIKEIVINEEVEIVDHLPLGVYYLKEKKNSNYYLPSSKIYEVNITKDKSIIYIEAFNKLLKKKIKIYKTLEGDIPESGVKFIIYDKDNKPFLEVVTNEKGEAEFSLPYGEYVVKQANGANGYSFADDLNITVKDDVSETYELVDMKIPNAGLSKKDIIDIKIIISTILLSISIGLYTYDKVCYKDN